MAEKGKERIVNKLKCDQYFDILLDCTRDVGHVE
jgi:hypothetical protein